MSLLTLAEQSAAPSSPSSGKVTLYWKNDGFLYTKDASGTEIKVNVAALITTAGDILYGTGANALSRLGIGTAGQVLRVNAGATAPEWKSVPCVSVYNSAQTTIAAAGFTKVGLQTEDFDIGGYFDSTTNYRYTPLVAGIYQVNWTVNLTGTNVTATDRYIACLYKNGTLYRVGNESAAIAGGPYTSAGATLVSMNGSTDYLELYFYNSNVANTVTTGGTAVDTFFTASYVGPSA